MTTFLIRRLVQCAIVLLIVSIIVFIAMRLLPGDPLMMLVAATDTEEFTQAQLDALMQAYLSQE